MKVIQARIIYRQWGKHGLRETERRFDSLDDLFALSLALENPKLVDRIVITGRDAEGQLRTITFAFQSLLFDD